MKSAARLQAAIEVLADVLRHDRPAASALADWGRAHRFAGSGDRAAIGNLVYDALRRKASAAHLLGADTPRAIAFGTMRLVWGETAEAIAALADGSRHAPAVLTPGERAALSRDLPADAPGHILGDFPAWLSLSLERAFGSEMAAQMRALGTRAPLDVRTNTLRSTREAVLEALAQHGAVPTPLSPLGVRMPPSGPSGRLPNVERHEAHGDGRYEVQDEGSQIAALLTGVKPGMAVADVCAGAGGKTLALAAAMENRGVIHAYDSDRARLRPIHDRLQRAGAGIVTVLEAGRTEQLTRLTGGMDVVLVDAPCTGSGVWRRHPEAKWRLSPADLEQRRVQQVAVLDLAALLVKPGGRLVYVTCSVLPEENADQVAAFLTRRAAFDMVPAATAWAAAIGGTAPASADGRADTLLLTPRTHGTDGFFVAVMERRD
jgi:16S rRNA (cytosine967-C5)-methyltransferase